MFDPVFKVTRYQKEHLKNAYPAKPFPLSKNHVANPPKMYHKEEEKVKRNQNNKENITINRREISKLQKLEKPQKSHSGESRKLPALNTLEKEVKLTSVEFNKQKSSDELYNDERIALEDEYGLNKDDLFKLDETDDYETQSMLAESYEKLNSTHPMNQISNSNNNGDSTETCNDLKKGIDNDEIIADITTMDGLSMYEDILEGTQKKLVEDEEIENLNVFLKDVYQQSESQFLLDSNTKIKPDSLEEEKVAKTGNKSTSENFQMMVDFKDDDYEMDFEAAFYNVPTPEASVPLFKKNSSRQERGFSLFEDSPQMFESEYFNKQSDVMGRNRSMSKITVDDWYKKDWRNHAPTEKSGLSVTEKDCDDMDVDEPEYFKKFDSVLLSHSQPKESIVTPVIYSEISGLQEPEFLMGELDPLKESEDNFIEQIARNEISYQTEEGYEFSSQPP